MVIEDPFSPDRTNYTDRRSVRPKFYRLAAPTDRLAAFLIDVLFLFPIVNLLFAPFYRESMRAYLYHFDHVAFYIVVLGIASLLLLVSLYFTITTSLWGASPGKRILNLKVISSEGHRTISITQSFVRSMAISIELCMFGLPFLSSFTDSRRRPFHDRIADTLVVSEKEYYAVAPTEWERRLVKSFYLCAILFAFMFTAPFVLKISEEFRTTKILLKSDKYLCSSTNQAVKDWSGDSESRLEIAMTLYAAGDVDESCLNKEADYALWSEKEMSTAYLAKAFGMSDHPRLSDTYLERTCKQDKNSDACFLSQLVGYWTAGKIDEVSGNLFDRIYTSSSFVKVWSIRHFLSSGHHGQVLSLIDELPNSGALGHFTSSYRTKALYLLGQKESAQASLKSSLENSDLQLRLRLSAWYCTEETHRGCPQQSAFACQSFLKNFSDQWLYSNESEVALGVLRAAECSDKTAKELKALAKNSPSSDVKMFLESFALKKEGKFDKARDNIKRLAKVGLVNGGVLAHEAAIRWISMEPTPEDLRFIKAMWSKESSQSRSWERLGVELIHYFYSKGEKLESYKLAQEIYDRRPYSVKALQVLGLQAYFSGDQAKAREFAQTLRLKRQGEVNLRRPASVTEPRAVDEDWQRVLSSMGKGAIQ